MSEGAGAASDASGCGPSAPPIPFGSLVLGAWAFGGEHWGDDGSDAESIAAVHAAFEGGIRWIDTAPLYGNGHADEVLGRALEELGARRHEVQIATKVGPRPAGAEGHPRSRLDRRRIREDLEGTLARLGVERVALVQTHWPDEEGTPIAETVAALEELVEEGKAGAWGVCNVNERGLHAVAARARPATLQVPYSMLRRDLEHDGLGEAARSLGVPLLAYETLGRGLLTGKFRGLPRFPKSDMRARDPRFWGTRFFRTMQSVELLRQAATRLGAPTAALPVAWALAQPGVAAAIVGAKRPEQVRQWLEVRELAGDARTLKLLEKIAGTFR